MLTAGNSSRLGKLPVELIDAIAGGNDGTMSRAEAEAYRLKVMDERTTFAQGNDSDYFSIYLRPRSVFFSLIVSTPNTEITETLHFSSYGELMVLVYEVFAEPRCIITCPSCEVVDGFERRENDDPSSTLNKTSRLIVKNDLPISLA